MTITNRHYTDEEAARLGIRRRNRPKIAAAWESIKCAQCGSAFQGRRNRERRFCGRKCAHRFLSGERAAGYKDGSAVHKREWMRRWRAANPEKQRAYSAVKQALKTGALKKGPCADCGSPHRIHAHHEDYSKPLEVVWLCYLCHAARHRNVEAA